MCGNLTHRLALYPVSVRRLVGFATPLPPPLTLPSTACGSLHLAEATRGGTFTRENRAVPGTPRKTTISYDMVVEVVVEPRGVEPLSEDQKTRASPSAVCVLTFPPPGSRRQDSGFSSFIKSRRPQSLRRLVPCFYDADGLRRRRLRVDDRRLGGDSYVIVVVSSICFPLSGGTGPPLASLSLRIPVETKIRPRVGRRELKTPSAILGLSL